LRQCGEQAPLVGGLAQAKHSGQDFQVARSQVML
jgi:hypothetical protein